MYNFKCPKNESYIYISRHIKEKKLRIKSDKFEQRKTIPIKSIRFMYFLHKGNYTK